MILLLLGCGEPCTCPATFPVDLVFPEPGALVPLGVVPVFGPEGVGYTGGLAMTDAAGAPVRVAGLVEGTTTVLVEVQPLDELVAGETYTLWGDGAAGRFEITSFTADDVPAEPPTAVVSGTVSPSESRCTGDVLRLEFVTNAAWLEVIATRQPQFVTASPRGGLAASPDGLELDPCRWDGFESDAIVRVRPHGVDGTLGPWSEPLEIPWSEE